MGCGTTSDARRATNHVSHHATNGGKADKEILRSAEA